MKALGPLGFGISLSLALGSFLSVAHFDLPFCRLTESWAVRVFWVGLLAVLAAGVVRCVLRRAGGCALVSCGMLAGVFLLGVETAEWSRGTLRLGEGETNARWEPSESGVLATSPPPLTYLGRGDPGFRVAVGDRELLLGVGEWGGVGDHWDVNVVRVAPAPSFALHSQDGPLLNEGLVKLAPGQEDEFIRVGLLPHRFYLSLPEESADQALDDTETDTPLQLHLRITRGKLTALDSVVEKGTPVNFEGLAFQFDDGASWAELELRRRPRTLPFAVSALLIVCGVAVLARERSRR